jgi:hypothetical protein
VTDQKTEVELLRDTLQEVRRALPKCRGGYTCQRVATFTLYDEDCCDEHHNHKQYELPIAPVARRLGW